MLNSEGTVVILIAICQRAYICEPFKYIVKYGFSVAKNLSLRRGKGY